MPVGVYGELPVQLLFDIKLVKGGRFTCKVYGFRCFYTEDLLDLPAYSYAFSIIVGCHDEQQEQGRKHKEQYYAEDGLFHFS